MDRQPHPGSSEQPSLVAGEPQAGPPFPAARERRSVLLIVLKAVVTVGFLLYASLFVYHAYQVVTFPYDVDNSEGFLLYGGHRLPSLYRDITSPPYLVDNYPPLYPLLLAIGDRLLGISFVWGRSLSALATVGIAVLLYLWIAGLSGRHWPALLSALCFLSSYHVYDWGALARVDMVAIFLSVLGLVLIDRGKGILLPVVCFLLALCTRQTMLAAPLAAFLFLYYREERRVALTLLLSVGIATSLLYVLFQLLSSGAYFRHVFLYNLNEYRLWDLFLYFRHWWATYPILGGIAVFFFLERWRSRRRDLVVCYLLFASISALLCGKIGSAPNYLLELVVACSLALGSVLAEVELAERGNRAILTLLLPVLLLAQLLATIHWPLTRLDFSYTPTREDLYDGQRVEQVLRGSPGPVLAERAGLPLLAGHEPVYEPFICTQLARQGLWDERPLLKQIENQEFPSILLTWNIFERPADPERFSKSFVAAVAESYEIDQTLGRFVIYRPKAAKRSPSLRSRG